MKDGLTPTINLIASFASRPEVVDAEINLIKDMRSSGVRLTNGTDGGDGGAGYKFSAEQLQKISEARKGKKLKPWTEERRKKMEKFYASGDFKWNPESARKRIGIKFSEEHLAKIRAFNATKRGVSPSAEARAKMSASQKGRRGHWRDNKMSEEHKLKVRIAMQKRSEKYKYLSDFVKAINILSSYLAGKIINLRGSDVPDGLRKYVREIVNKRLSEKAKIRMQDPETRRRMRLIAIGNRHMVGKKHSEETKIKLSLAKKGIPWSDSRRAAQNVRSHGLCHS